MIKVWILSKVLSDEDADLIDIGDLKKTTDDNYYEAIKLRSAFKKLGADVKIVRIKKIDESILIDDLPNIIILRCMVYTMKEIDFLNELCRRNIVIMNNPISQMISPDKSRHYKLLEKFGVPIPTTLAINVWANDEEINNAIKGKLSFPMVVKSNCGSRADTVFKCHNTNEILECADKIATVYPSSRKMLLQQWIDHRKRGIITVFAIGGKLIAAQLRTANRELDFLISNYREDTNRTIYHATDELCKLVEKSCEAVGHIEMTKMDILYDGEKYLICEINTPGGFIGFDNFMNLDCGLMIAEYALDKYKKMNH